MEGLSWKICICLIFKVVIGETEQLSPTTVELKYGQGIIVGVREESGIDKPFYAFKGIPYAEPPVGELRFKAPVGGVKWTGKRNGTMDPPHCPQLQNSNLIGKEDCLFLNIFTPGLKPGNVSYPVMVYIHGGDFLNGGASDYPPLPLVTRDIVLVVLQYRLGVLGFLSTEDELLPGNLGLKDQTMALHWVKENVRTFGGHPHKVTIFGSGSGAASVHYQILTPYSKGLFSRAILQSGSSLCPRMLRKSHAFLATELITKLNCRFLYPSISNSPYSANLMKCLKYASVEAIVTSYTNFLEWRMLPLLNVPRVDGDYLPDHPAVLMKAGNYNKVDLIAGFNQHDGSIVTAPLYNNSSFMKEFRENFLNVGALTMAFDEEENPAHLAGIAYHSYMQFKDPKASEGANALTKLFTDRLFGVCMDDMLSLHAEASDSGNHLYAYRLVHRGIGSFCNAYDTAFDDSWVCHGDDIQYFFDGVSGFSPLETREDRSLGKIMVTLWTNFATYGNPTPDNSLGFQWDTYTLPNRRQLELKQSPNISLNYCNKTCGFWHSLSFGWNKYLFSNEIGLKNSAVEEEEDFDGAHQPVFKTALEGEKLKSEELYQWSLINHFMKMKNLIDPTSQGGGSLSASNHLPVFIVADDDLIAAAGLWSVAISPIANRFQTSMSNEVNAAYVIDESNQQCSGIRVPTVENLYHKYFQENVIDIEDKQTCNGKLDHIIKNPQSKPNIHINAKGGNTKTEEMENISLYDLIEAGLLKANILLKGVNEAGVEEGAVHIVEQDNLQKVIEGYGDYVSHYLKEKKVSREELEKIKKQREEAYIQQEEAASRKLAELELVTLEKPKVIVDKRFPNKKMIHYGKVENIIKENNKIRTPILMSSESESY